MRLHFASVFALACLACPAFGQVVLYNSYGFEASGGYALGNLDGQNGWGVDTPPGAYTVQNSVVQSGSQAAGATGGQTNWIFPAINYAPLPTELIRIEADIARSTPSPTPSFAFGIDVYNSAVLRTTRFGLVNNAGVIQPFVTSRLLSGAFNPAGSLSNVLIGGAVPANTFVHFEARLNYVAKNLRLFVNGADVGADIPFADLAANDLADADWHVSSSVGATDQGFLDNYTISTVPEPTSMALVGLVGIGFGIRRKLSHKK